MQIATIGLDIAKHVFQVHAVDAEGAVVIRRRYSRAQLMQLFKDKRGMSFSNAFFQYAGSVRRLAA